ncbi:hypothetical protein E1212_22650 [Jiangella ureilytica]|uniref:Uncharacterized protein n=1 Tax=Jiangella ureilytica TaxID=2530374 RepID=A0A4R4RFH5_9ACTN|nr:hypothetical protein E1212_22650 [Jiangella ureilytica]
MTGLSAAPAATGHRVRDATFTVVDETGEPAESSAFTDVTVTGRATEATGAAGSRPRETVTLEFARFTHTVGAAGTCYDVARQTTC